MGDLQLVVAEIVRSKFHPAGIEASGYQVRTNVDSVTLKNIENCMVPHFGGTDAYVQCTVCHRTRLLQLVVCLMVSKTLKWFSAL